jgi:hypothetical protein
LNEIITAFVQNKSAIERGLFDQENIVPEELTQLALGKIVQEKYPELELEDQEAVRQHAIAAFNLIQQAKKSLNKPSKHLEAQPLALVELEIQMVNLNRT